MSLQVMMTMMMKMMMMTTRKEKTKVFDLYKEYYFQLHDNFI